ncbi:uncharacterized protein LOC121393603 isoform X2 [Xenopus laevis]|uniref:Hemogen n=2 Tax=Xenopus laevis TaxID=8355 RepID=A0A974E096_XENLA|nr:uncharacterized protein LOC121393603 isoform X2 [Xenopus laevis]OCU00721.1 hypothetical protein XELAEV_18006500mg [Xenopus laevis]
MEGFEKDYHYSDVAEISTVPSQPQEVQQDILESITRRLRDRTLLKRKREEAQEKDSFQGQTSSKGQRKGKTTGRGRRKVQKTEPEPDVHIELAPEVEPQPEPEVLQEETENGQEHLHYHEDPGLTVTKEGNEDATFLTHESQEAGHISHISIPFLTEDKEPEPEEEASPVSLATIPLPEALSFSQEHQREEQNIYTYLL